MTSGRVSASCTRDDSCHSSFVIRHLPAFTLIELLVVIAILGILAGLAVPAFKALGKSDATVSASRQLLDDVGRARQMAMAQRTTVYMVFVPASFWTIPPGGVPAGAWWMSLNSFAQTAVTNLCDEQLTGYTFMSHGTVGDQPGNHQWHYLAPWQSLPDGTFIATNKFNPPNQPNPAAVATLNNNATFNIYGFITNAVPFPLETNSTVILPCIIFDSFGHLVDQNGNIFSRHEYIPLARGSAAPAVNPGTKTYQLAAPSVTEIPAGNSTNAAANIVDIDPLTGRAVLQFFKIQ